MPLYTVADAAQIVDVSRSTLDTWVRGYIRTTKSGRTVTGEPMIAHFERDRRGDPTIPFVGLTEALVLAAVRSSGVSLQKIRPALVVLQLEIGIEHALASQRLYSDGAELLYDYAEKNEGTEEGQETMKLVVVRNGQGVISEVVRQQLERIEYAPDGYARLIRVPAYRKAEVVVDPERSFGAPILEHGGARVEDVLQRFWAGESLLDLEEEFGVPVSQLEDVVRVASKQAA